MHVSVLFVYDVHRICQSNQVSLEECGILIGQNIRKDTLEFTRGSLPLSVSLDFFAEEPFIQDIEFPSA